MSSTKPTILVTGATGKTGFATVAELRKRDIPVRALVHTDDQRVNALKALGVEIVIADLFNPLDMRRAMNGVQRAYFCPPWHPHMLDSAMIFIEAASEAKLEGVVTLSQWLANPTHPSLATRQNWHMEKIYSLIPEIPTVVINPGFFADNYMALIGFAAQLGVFPWPTAKSLDAPSSNEDIARVAVAALLNPEKYHGQRFRPTGPELLSAREMASVFSKVLNRKVRHIDMPMFMFLKAIRVMGLPTFQQAGLKRYIEDHRSGAFESGAPTDHVRKLTGLDPESFETIAKRYALRPEAQKTFTSKVSALWTFMRIGFTPARNLDCFERTQAHPLLLDAKFSVDSETWRREHL